CSPALRLDPRRLDEAWHGDDLAPPDDERPCLSLRAGDLRVDEHVLHLLGAAGEPVAGAPASYLKASELRFDRPLAPAHPAFERDGCLLEPDAVVLAHRGEAAAEVDAAGAGRCGRHGVELRPGPLAPAEAVSVAAPRP